MTNTHSPAQLTRALLVTALLCAPGLAAGQAPKPDEAPAQEAKADRDLVLPRPASTISLGVGYLSSDAPLAGEYTGLHEQGGYFLGDVDIVRRFDDTGTWIRLRGTDLGLDSRELRFEHERQGDWGYSIDYSEIPRFDPYTVNTTLTGIGTSTQTIGGTTLRPVELDSKRKRLTFELEKFLPANFDLKLKFRTEKRDGARSLGEMASNFFNFNYLTEPLDSTTNQIDAVLSYTGEKLQLSAGYYGSFYDQHDNRIDNPAGNFDPIAMPPGNQSHQIYLTGGYSFTRSTRGTFKLKYAHTTQEETFVVPTANGRTDADAELDVFSAQIGATSRPTSRLSLIGNFSYEKRDDNTPLDDYIPAPGNSTRNGQNSSDSSEVARGKLEASYLLPKGFRFTGGVDYDMRVRSVPPVRSVAYRKKNEEVSYRAELQRSLSETVNGRLTFTRSRRFGSAILPILLNNGSVPPANAGLNLVTPINVADRDRNKLRLAVDWAATERLSLQGMVWYASDTYTLGPDVRPNPPTGEANPYGPQSGNAHSIAVDAAYLLSDTWTTTAWYSQEFTQARSRTERNAANVRTFEQQNTSHAVGLGLEGAIRRDIKAGAEFSFTFDRGEFDQTALTGAALPEFDNVYYRNARLKLYAIYDISPNTGVRVDLVHDRWDRDDWQWDGFSYTDGTTVYNRATENNTFIGISGFYRFW